MKINYCLLLDCASLGTTFQELQNSYLSGLSDVTLANIKDVVQCMTLCIAETAFVCGIAEYHGGYLFCALYSDETFCIHSDPEPMFNPSDSYDYYLRDCAA